jgi:mannose/cellobiose epimerase-like protein (N-acyl-D-glucosamine 2-epimerase family)
MSVFYVDDAAAGLAGDEPSWRGAYTDLRQPLDAAAATTRSAAGAESHLQNRAVTSAHVDAAAVRDGLIRFVDTWNGGQLGKFGTSGMGTYSPAWDGLFRTNLDQQFDPVSAHPDDMTVISQARAVYINVEAYRNAPAGEQARFKAAVKRGADYLLAKAIDPNTYIGKPGGMWWGLQSDGTSPPTHTTRIGGTAPRHKNAYGQVQSLFALAHAYTVTGDVRHLNGAFAQLDVWNQQFADTAAGPGAFLPTANENYTQRVDTRNVDYMTHAFEALLTLDDATPAADPRKAGLAKQVTDIGNFITTRMYRDAPGSTTMGYLPWNYDAGWGPDPDPALQYSTPGHNFEVAFLLSRAVEPGFNPAWLGVANKLVAYTLRNGFDNVPASPTYGAVPNGKLAFDGSRFDPAPPDLVWWQQSEAARALLHFAAVRGRSDLWDEYEASAAFIRNRFVDPVYGGWFTHLDPFTLAPTTRDKGTVWTGGYHEAMLDAERLRVATADGAVTYEAEQAVITGALVSGSHSGFGGTGYVDFANATGDSVEFIVNAPAAGLYELGFRHANGSGADRSMGLSLNGQTVPGGVSFTRTGSWVVWDTARITVTLAAGTNKVRLAATGQSGPNLDSLTVCPVATPAQTYQAEGADLSGPVIASNISGYTGSGFADYQHGTGDSVAFAVDVPAAGAYALGFRYANGATSDRPLELTVDGRVVAERLSFAPTWSWRTWKDVVQQATLTAGRHAVRLTAVGFNGPNLDALSVTPGAAPPAEPAVLQAEAAALSGPTVASNVAGYTGSGFVDYQHARGDWVEWSVHIAAAGTYRLEIRYANGSPADRALDLSVNGAVVRPQVSFPNTGGWSAWKTVTVPVTLAAGTSKVRLTSAGFNGPNLDSLTVPAGPSAAPGTVDATFGAAGVVKIDLGANYGDFGEEYPGDTAYDLVPLASGRTMVAGSGDLGYELFRLRADGSVDAPFGGPDGNAIPPVWVEKWGSAATAVAPLPGGKWRRASWRSSST